MVGQYNASITQRLNNLTDKQEITQKVEQPLFGDEGEVASTCCADVCFGAERQPDEVRRMAPAPDIAAPAAYICRRCRRIPGASKSLAPALRIIAAVT